MKIINSKTQTNKYQSMVFLMKCTKHYTKNTPIKLEELTIGL